MLPVRARLPDESAAAKPWSAASALMGLGRDLGKSLTQLARSWAPPEEDPLPGTPRNGGTIAVGTASGRLRVVNALTGDSLLNVEHHQGHSLPVLCVAMSSDGSLLASGCRDRTWKLWDASGAELLCRKGHSDAVWAIAVSGQRVATGGYDKNIVLWDTRTGEEARRLLGHTSGISSLSFSPCGARLASGSWDQSVRVWDLSSGGVLREIRKAHRSAVCSVSFFPDGQRLVSGGGGSEAKVWEIEAPVHTTTVVVPRSMPTAMEVWSGTGPLSEEEEALLTLKGHTAQVNAVVVSPDGLLIATGSADFTVKIWDAASGGEVACVRGHDFLKECICRQGHREPSCPRVGHSGIVQAVAFSSDSRTVASGGIDGVVMTWDAKTGSLIRSVDVGSKVFSVAMSRDFGRDQKVLAFAMGLHERLGKASEVLTLDAPLARRVAHF